MTLLLGVAVLVILIAALKGFSKADPRGLAKGARIAGGVAALGGGAFLVARGQIGLGVPLGLTGLGLLGWLPFGGATFGQRTQKSPGQVSRVRSAFLEMELDHDSATMRGRIVAGRFAGAPLDGLDVTTLVGLSADMDEESRTLLAAYLDRRSPGWREHAQGGAGAGQGGAPGSGKMTEQEAYQILGLEPGASADDIGRAHRLLMKKLHPDQGGATYLAARVNEAKEVLLRGHR
ncbi:DnaJ domain-containing protein [Rhodoplanes azumiensis]|uniref:DnaJ domain-containing protein n=1 Tax=Rhodoplanes azumiensis TaxID=1897628 RepID=A0ABW5AGE9_9BRAD